MRKKNEDTMHAICAYVEAYFLTHHTSPSITKIAEEVGLARSGVHRYLTEMNEKGLIFYNGKTIATSLTQKTNTQMATASILGSISCGLPLLSEENIEECVTLPASLFGRGELFILRASGNSMIEAGIDDGDLVVIQKQKTAQDGDVVVALVDGENTLKRFYKDEENRRIILHPENREMEDIITTQCEIQGVAQHVIKAL